MNPPTSQWAEFIVFYSSGPDSQDVETYYVIPRAALTRHTSRSPESKWLKESEEAWHLLRELKS
jgi:hypothetical protein